jgi:hypothetical protein
MKDLEKIGVASSGRRRVSRLTICGQRSGRGGAWTQASGRGRARGTLSIEPSYTENPING